MKKFRYRQGLWLRKLIGIEKFRVIAVRYKRKQLMVNFRLKTHTVQ